MTVNEAMLTVAGEIAKENGYITTREPYKHYARKDTFWGNLVKSLEEPDLHILTAEYILPAFEGEPSHKIDIDMYFGRPRLNVRLPEACAHLTYRHGVLSETQAFFEGGLELAMNLKERIDKLIATEKDESHGKEDND